MRGLSPVLLRVGVFYLLAWPAMPLLAAPAPAQIQVQAQSSMRGIGYFIGDVSTQTVTVHTPAGFVLDKSSLPAIGMDANSLDLLASNYTHHSSSGGTQHRLQLSWQNFRAMQEIRSYPLRPLQLVFRREAQTINVPVAAARIVVASMLPTMMDSSSAEPRPDSAPQAVNISVAAIWLGLCLVLALSVLLLLLWRYDALPWYRQHPPPFHRAWRELRSIASSADRDHPDSMLAALVLLRRAFDHALGRAVSTEALPEMFTVLPWLMPLQSEITSFYRTSERMLFSGHLHTQADLNAASLNTAQLRQLARSLMLIERA